MKWYGKLQMVRLQISQTHKAQNLRYRDNLIAF